MVNEIFKQQTEISGTQKTEYKMVADKKLIESVNRLGKERNAVILYNFTGSTSQMSHYVKESEQKEFIVGTETNFVYRLKADIPDKMFYPVYTFCEGMNTISLEKIKRSLEIMEYQVSIADHIRAEAKIALDKMLEDL